MSFFKKIFSKEKKETLDKGLEKTKTNFFDKLTKAVEKRLLSDRPIGCLLSGGLDSSIITSILIKNNKNLKTFSIGLEG